MTTTHCNTDELKNAWRRTGMARIVPFETAIASRAFSAALRGAALHFRRRQTKPMHPALARHF